MFMGEVVFQVLFMLRLVSFINLSQSRGNMQWQATKWNTPLPWVNCGFLWVWTLFKTSGDNVGAQLNKIYNKSRGVLDILMQNSHILHLYLLQRHFKSSKTGLCGSVTPWSSCVTWWEPCWSVLLCCCATNMQVLLVIVCPQQWIKIVINNQDEADHAVFWPGGHNRTEVEVNLNATQRNVQCSLCSINLC